ncbi:MAG: hypothetical protein DRP97_06280 [Candidatus Latescibacterota bacterium]|nr:MAG: hypothetical protein B1H02_02465 [Candidatus Latescibacteria bacterium 4484_107]RKY68452.1 MAG: hypothetical protein DRP97_06280 [Candidatus Latescibacterota bacterium]
MKLSDIVHCVVIDPRKLTHYALDPDAPWGRHKAMVFKRSLGFTQANYADLLIQIEKKALESEAFFHSVDKFGRRYTVDLFICGTGGQNAIVRTAWLVPPGADEAYLVTLYVRKSVGDTEKKGASKI